jgi:phospholipid/cholesterol/gamma-HCH transport system substrate-binding protein
METRANYILIGLFTLATLVGAFTFIYWFEHLTSGVVRAAYRVVIDGPVAGLRKGASVTFNGIRVGDVADIRLDPQNPKRVIAGISIDSTVPVRADTTIALEFQGLTGIASLALRGNSTTSAAPEAEEGQPPVLVADPSATQDVTETARAVLRRVDTMVAENQEALRTTIRNLEVVSETFAKNSERFNHIIVGAENLLGGPDGKGGEVAETVRSIKSLSDNLDKRTADISSAFLKFTNSWDLVAADARRAVGSVDRAVRNFDRNPSRIIFGGGNGEAEPAKPATTAPKRQ